MNIKALIKQEQKKSEIRNTFHRHPFVLFVQKKVDIVNIFPCEEFFTQWKNGALELSIRNISFNGFDIYGTGIDQGKGTWFNLRFIVDIFNKNEDEWREAPFSIGVGWELLEKNKTEVDYSKWWQETIEKEKGKIELDLRVKLDQLKTLKY